MFVYIIVCSENLKIYIGQHKGDNLQKYLQQKLYEAQKRLSARSHLYAAMRQHSRETWSIYPLVSGIDDRKELNELEQHFIKVLKVQHPDVGYNICDGGEGFAGPQSEEAKRKISLGLTGRSVSVETRAKIGAANALTALGNKNWEGRHHSPETKEKIRQYNVQGVCGMLGRAHSQETKTKMRHPHRMSPEGIAAIRAARAASKFCGVEQPGSSSAS